MNKKSRANRAKGRLTRGGRGEKKGKEEQDVKKKKKRDEVVYLTNRTRLEGKYEICEGEALTFRKRGY